MTDEQANNITREQAIRILHPDTSIEAIDDYEEAGNYEHAYDTACLMAVDALRGPEPDPETGLVPCGCGGEADCNDVRIMDKNGTPLWWVECLGCGISTYGHQKKDAAKAAWNRAMSGVAISQGEDCQCQ